ncbi:Uncharacterised protein [Chlamydia trachomatis]|nr:Uncharacterised protein [Chlamydia trachomatis]
MAISLVPAGIASFSTTSIVGCSTLRLSAGLSTTGLGASGRFLTITSKVAVEDSPVFIVLATVTVYLDSSSPALRLSLKKFICEMPCFSSSKFGLKDLPLTAVIGFMGS